MNIHDLSVQVLSILLVAYVAGYSVCEQSKQNNAKVFLKWLPELFSDQILPVRPPVDKQCVEFLGCFERFPLKDKAQDIQDIGTKFQVVRRHQNIRVDWKPIENCLINSNQCITYPLNLNRIVEADFDPNLRTVVIAHGYINEGGWYPSKIGDWRKKMRDVMLKLEDFNVIVVEWSKGSVKDYITATANMVLVARQTIVLLYYLTSMHGANLIDQSFLDNLHLIGLSLGTQMMSFIGRDLGGRAGRITGLDPAGPMFEHSKFQLDKTRAQFVDVLHCNGPEGTRKLSFGVKHPCGHLDLYANDGTHQQNCHPSFNIRCNHNTCHDHLIGLLERQLLINNDPKCRHRNCNYSLAYKADNFKQFENGTSFVKYCPQVTLDDQYSDLNDLDRCSIPIDYITRFDKYRDYLARRHGLNFHDPNVFNKYYFYTSPKQPYIDGTHNLLKFTSHVGKTSTSSERCNLKFVFQMSDGKQYSHRIKNYIMPEGTGNNQIIIPYLSYDSDPLNNIAILEPQDFRLDEPNLASFSIAIARNFPKSIQINGLKFGSGVQSRQGGRIKRVVSRVGSKLKDKAVKDRTVQGDVVPARNECDFEVDLISVMNLRKMSRKILVDYSNAAQVKQFPDVKIAGVGVRPGKNLVLRDKDENQSTVFIERVYVGPMHR